VIDYGVAFVVFGEAISRTSVAPIWAVLFFVMLILLSIDAQVQMSCHFMENLKHKEEENFSLSSSRLQ